MSISLPGIPSIWKIATGGAALACLVLISLLTSSYFENRDLLKQRSVLIESINNPKTGYVAQLAQAHTNEATLTLQVKHQNDEYDKLSKKSQADLAASEARLAKVQAENKAMDKKLASFLATKPQGPTLEDRVRDIDARAMAEFVK